MGATGGNDNRRMLLMGLIAAAVICVAGGAGFYAAYSQGPKVVRQADAASSESTEVASAAGAATSSLYSVDNFDGSITYKGVRYEPNTHIKTVLFLGIDNSDQSRKGVGIDEGGRSDTMVLFIVDSSKKLITPLIISRDTMVNVDIYDNDGEFLSQGLEQITMQYSYGQNAQEASNLTKQKVADLLCRTRINSVVSLTMDGIEPVVNAIGNITLQLQTDETALDPSYTKGAVITLDGPAAKDFVHIRDTEIRGSNNERMSRQAQFMLALSQTARSKGISMINTMEKSAGKYLYEDIDADTADCFAKYDAAKEVEYLPGKNVKGTLHDEFYVDEDELFPQVLKLFYLPAQS
ncbi:MAG: LCP family protein [Butyrivibrio sp.]|jgi:LCP family protein required for cell wall assembly|nr:LCP family protein [Butyrivibrio sp.]